MKTRICAYCIFARYVTNSRWGLSFVCAKGHKPRFYPPAHMGKAMAGDYGYKRKCADYKEEGK